MRIRGRVAQMGTIVAGASLQQRRTKCTSVAKRDKYVNDDETCKLLYDSETSKGRSHDRPPPAAFGTNRLAGGQPRDSVAANTRRNRVPRLLRPTPPDPVLVRRRCSLSLALLVLRHPDRVHSELVHPRHPLRRGLDRRNRLATRPGLDLNRVPTGPVHARRWTRG